MASVPVVARATWSTAVTIARGAVSVNDLGADTKERVRDAYGSTKFARLSERKERWDPSHLSRLNANIVPHGAATRQDA
ncbi:MAG: BBE domain-containing protein [Gemmatimonadaceae bacterium]